MAAGVQALVVPAPSRRKPRRGRGSGERSSLRQALSGVCPAAPCVSGRWTRRLQLGGRCASTSNRNFEGRQGRAGRTHLVSPAMAAALLPSPAASPTFAYCKRKTAMTGNSTA
ncbi:aconitase family protein [Escherichia coli]